METVITALFNLQDSNSQGTRTVRIFWLLYNGHVLRDSFTLSLKTSTLPLLRLRPGSIVRRIYSQSRPTSLVSQVVRENAIGDIWRS